MILGVIPARFSSTRLMGKPLADICGRPMIQHTFDSASKSKLLNKIVIATDDEKIFEVCKSFKADVFLTPKNLPSGSDRIAYVVKNYFEAEIVVNIQGDEPFIPSKMIDQAISPLLFDESVSISTLAKKIERVDELKSPDVVKVVFDYFNFALYFSRSAIPFVRDAKNYDERIEQAEFYKHVGLYVFRKEALLKFTSLKQTYLEQIEKLEQLRMLENGMKIKVVETEFESISVDTQEDLEFARSFFLKKMKKKNR